jgi:drug/metabolite transporter (DMT)-like permease
MSDNKRSDTLNTTKPSYTAWLLIVILALIWGSSFILMKRGLESFTAPQVAALRMLIAALCLLPFLLRQLKELPIKKIPILIAAGWLGNGIPAFLFTEAETVISSALAGVLNALTPLFTLIIGVLVFKTEFKWSKTLGVLVGLVGAVVLMLLGADGKLNLNNASYGLYIVVATVCYGLNVNIIRQKLSGLNSMLISSAALFTVGLGCGIYLFNTDFVHRMSTVPYAWNSLLYVAILGIFGTAISLVLFNRLIKISGVLFAASCTYFIPIVAVGWGVLDGEVLGVVHLLGLGLILVGVYMVNKK